MKGGKREGSGRKRSENKKIRVSFSLAPDVVKYIRQRTDKPQAQIIEDAIRLLNYESDGNKSLMIFDNSLEIPNAST